MAASKLARTDDYQDVQGGIRSDTGKAQSVTVIPVGSLFAYAVVEPDIGGNIPAAGWSVSSQTSLTTTVEAVKTSAGSFGGYMVYNPNSTAAYVQVFNATTTNVTLGTTTPTFVIPLPGGAAANIEFKNGIPMSTAISVAFTTTATGSTAPGTNAVAFFLYV